jgi:3-hydroxybutyrate dehydrogenase
VELNGKIALVTGSARGIGKAIALRFAQEGARVALNDINDKSLEETTNQIQEAGGEKTIYKKADVSKSKEARELIQYVVEKLGVIDILVNNAAISRIISFLDTSERLWDRIMEVNLKGAFLCCKAVIPGMIKKGEGKIINMSSQSGKRGSTWHAAYCVSKFGIIGLTQSLALELAPYKINVNAVCPGVVFTSLWQEQAANHARRRGIDEKKVKEDLIKKIPLGRLGTPVDVANLVLFLASSRSDYMTGQAINVSGGSILH